MKIFDFGKFWIFGKSGKIDYHYLLLLMIIPMNNTLIFQLLILILIIPQYYYHNIRLESRHLKSRHLKSRHLKSRHLESRHLTSRHERSPQEARGTCVGKRVVLILGNVEHRGACRSISSARSCSSAATQVPRRTQCRDPSAATQDGYYDSNIEVLLILVKEVKK